MGALTLLVLLTGSYCVPTVSKLLSEWGFESWPEFEIFLKLPQVAALSREGRKRLSDILIKDGTEDDFEMAFQQVSAVEEEVLNDAVAAVSPEGDWDFATLVSQIFMKRPKPAGARLFLKSLEAEQLKGRALDIMGDNLVVSGIVRSLTKPAGENDHYTLLLATELQQQPMRVHIAGNFDSIQVERQQRRVGFRTVWQDVRRLQEMDDFVFVQFPAAGGSPKGGSFAINESTTWRIQVRNARGDVLRFERARPCQHRLEALWQMADKVGDVVGGVASIGNTIVAGLGKMGRAWGRLREQQDICPLDGHAQTAQRSSNLSTNVTALTKAYSGGHRTGSPVGCSDGGEDGYEDEDEAATDGRNTRKNSNSSTRTAAEAPEKTDAGDPGNRSPVGCREEEDEENEVTIHNGSELVWRGSFLNLEYAVSISPVVREPVEGVTADTFDTLVQIHDDLGGNERRSLQRELEQAQHVLRQILKGNKMIHDGLLEAVIGSGDVPGAVDITDLRPHLDEIGRLQKDLGDTTTWQQNLQQAVAEALYERIVNPLDNSSEADKSPVVVERVFNMLRQAREHTEAMRGKNLVLLIGDTGSGKSTTASFLLGIPLREVKGMFEPAFVHKNSTDGGPKIGSSWCSSETLYSQGYPLKNSDVMLVDFPGFEDTRSSIYKVVTALSFDMALRAATRVSAVVLHVPYTLLAEKRGQAFIELLARIESRFPGLVDSVKRDSNHGLHILVTKCGRCRPDQKDSLKRGVFAHQAFMKCRSMLEQMIKADMVESDRMNQTCERWRSVTKLAAQGRIQIVALKDRQARKDLLASYTKSNQSLPTFGSSMSEPEVQKSLADCVQRHAHTWREQLLCRYLNGIPADIAQFEQNIATVTGSVRRAAEQSQQHVARLTKELQKLDAWIDGFEKLMPDSQSQSIETRQKLQVELAARTSEAAKAATQKHDSLKTETVQCQRNLSNLEKEVSSATESESRARANITIAEKKRELLSNGSTEVVVFEHDYTNQTNMSVCDHHPGELDAALMEVRELHDSYWTGCRDVLVAKHTGRVVVQAYIDRTYRLVPADAEVRKAFRASSNLEESFGQTIVSVSGLKFRMAARNPHPLGKSAVYRFEFNFDGSPPFPRVRAVHRIPNIDRNEAALINLEADLAGFLRSHSTSKKTLELVTQEHQSKAEECDKLARESAEAGKDADNIIAIDAKALLDAARLRRENKTQEIRIAKAQALINSQEEAEKAHRQIADYNATLRELRREKVHIAAVIHEGQASAQLLLELTNEMGRLSSPLVNKVNVLEELKDFQLAYTQAMAAGLEKSVKADLEDGRRTILEGRELR